ncbi:hypothetical protein SHL15_4650 [Streptomyces hygroscopicus subsp. limoneus]|nr:hypothetical protein SHL15_4650 [Streptomyces hygroscopicus subsp. limoneus]
MCLSTDTQAAPGTAPLSSITAAAQDRHGTTTPPTGQGEGARMTWDEWEQSKARTAIRGSARMRLEHF